MFQSFKQKVKCRLSRQLMLAARDIEAARQFRAAHESAAFVDQQMSMAQSYQNKFALLKDAMARVAFPGLYCEFGVYRGETINFIASLAPGEVHGFDSFQGLPEDWRQGFQKGKFAVGALPKVRPNVRLHKGWFEDTIPPFREQHLERIAFLHLDADLYSSTRTVFERLGDRIVPGSVIAFDEFFNYPGWREGEYKAFLEFCQERCAEVRYLGFVGRDEQAAAQVTSILPDNRKVIARESELTAP
jgi:hypothetical protein